MVRLITRMTGKEISDRVGALITGTETPFRELSAWMLRNALLAFQTSGARAGHRPWKALSPKTLRTRAGTYRIRRGSDGTPTPLNPAALSALRSAWVKKHGWGATGEMRPGVRRFRADSKPLLASGMFRNSWFVREASARRATVTTAFDSELAKKIMSDPTRQVLFVTEQDRRDIRRLFIGWIARKLK